MEKPYFLKHPVFIACAVSLLVMTTGKTVASERKLASVPDGYTVFTDQVISRNAGSKLIYTARKDAFEYVIDETNISKPYGVTRHLAISPDGNHIAFSAGKSEAEGEFYRVIDSVEAGPYSLVCNPVFSPDSRLLAFEAKIGNIWRHAISPVGSRDVLLTPPADIHYMGPVFSSDGRFIASIQMFKDKAVRIIHTTDLREVSRREYEKIGNTVYSIDKKRVAYAASKGGKFLVVTSSFAGGDEQEGRAYDLIFGPAISPDGKHVAYGAEGKGTRFLVIDSREIPAPLLLSIPVLSADGTKAAYVADSNRRPFVVAGERQFPRFDAVSGIAFSPAGAAVAYSARIEDKSFLVIGDVVGEGRYDSVDSIMFSSDGRHVGYRAGIGNKKFMVISDMQGRIVKEGPQVEALWTPLFAEDRINYVALTNNEFWRKELVFGKHSDAVTQKAQTRENAAQ